MLLQTKRKRQVTLRRPITGVCVLLIIVWQRAGRLMVLSLAIVDIFLLGGLMESALAQTPEPSNGEEHNMNSFSRKELNGEPSGWRTWMDLVGGLNPKGAMLLGGGDYRHVLAVDPVYGMASRYIETGFSAGLNPAYGRVGVDLEWRPHLVADLRISYNFIQYLGLIRGLLSFDSSKDEFNDSVLSSCLGDETPGHAHSLVLEPTLRAKLGPILFINQLKLAGYQFFEKGPWLYEPEHDLLLSRIDMVTKNRLQALLFLWDGTDQASVLLGPHYEITHGLRADLLRQQVGLTLFAIPEQRLWNIDRPHLYALTGCYLQDPNRQGSLYLVMGIGGDFDLEHEP